MRLRLRFGRLWVREEGSSLVELALLLPFLLFLLLATVDFGRAYYLAMEVAGAAHAGAEYGVQNPADSTGIQAAAVADAPNVSNLTPTVAMGCECPDGTLYSTNCASTPTCPANTVYRVDVTTRATYKPLFPWPGIPSSMSLSSTASMRSGGGS